MTFYLTALSLALATVFLAWGVYLSLRIFSLPDITTDGSFTLGACISIVLLAGGASWFVALLAATLFGALAGIATGFIHTRLHIHPLLSGILVMTALYSVNLLLMGRSNIPMDASWSQLFSSQLDSAAILQRIVILGGLVVVMGLLLGFVLRSDWGIALRATGQSEPMATSMGISVNRMKIAGLALANGLTGLSGALVVQLQGFADINMGIGMVIGGLGSVMIGEALVWLLPRPSVGVRLWLVVMGVVVFRELMALTLAMGIDPVWMKLLNAAIVLMFVALPLNRIRTLRKA
jgi:putative ABC transport system permease protein